MRVPFVQNVGNEFILRIEEEPRNQYRKPSNAWNLPQGVCLGCTSPFQLLEYQSNTFSRIQFGFRNQTLELSLFLFPWTGFPVAFIRVMKGTSGSWKKNSSYIPDSLWSGHFTARTILCSVKAGDLCNRESSALIREQKDLQQPEVDLEICFPIFSQWQKFPSFPKAWSAGILLP